MLIGMCSWIALIRILSTFGSNVIAGYTIGIRVIIFALLPASGVASAAATMVGQALGARKPERAEEAVKIAAKYSTLALTIVGAVLAIFAPWIAHLFTTDPDIAPIASNTLRIVACGFPFYAAGMVVSQSLNGAGDTRTPTILNFCVFWLWEIPLAYVLAMVMGFGPNGIYLSIAIAFSTYAVAGAAVFRRGTWKLKRV
jgi:Na+-driven multidrug efflux pump